jgi:hypothetical protein
VGVDESIEMPFFRRLDEHFFVLQAILVLTVADAILPGPVTEWLINRGTERITKAANAICLKDYSSFLKSKEAPA